MNQGMGCNRTELLDGRRFAGVLELCGSNTAPLAVVQLA
jgi:hypothetical protein